MDAASNLSELLFGRNPNVRSRLAADGALYACIDLLKRFVSHGRCKHRLVKQLAKERERERERERSVRLMSYSTRYDTIEEFNVWTRKPSVVSVIYHT